MSNFTLYQFKHSNYVADGGVSRILQKLPLPIVSRDSCGRKYNPLGFLIKEKQECAGGERGMDSCAGDSGGPLVKAYSLGGPGRFFLTGVVSFGLRECATSVTPGVYTKVAEYLDWILDTVRP